ncbi:ferrichrome-iron receptor [marine bacterium AO1-C]|nr:ferrichrome-iron receptor [marine bacterium AO1-C]
MKATKFTILLLLATFFTISSYGQSTIKGRVIDESNAPIVGATIVYSNSGKNLVIASDNNGNFSFENIDSKSGTIKISFIGYLTQEVNLANANAPLTVTLKQDTVVLQGVEVVGRVKKSYNSDYSFSATKLPIQNKELPQAISSITKELISDQQAFHVGDAVKVASGVIPSSFYNQFTIRGISQNEEGQIINGLRTRQFYFLQPLTTNIERVEVLKGPASVTLSSVDPGGSINMVTKKPLPVDRKEISMAAGSFSTIRGTLDFTGPLNESKTLLYRLNAAVQEAKSYRDLVNNKSLLISPSISYIPNDQTAVNLEIIYNNMEGNLDRGQPIFGAVAGVTDLNSTPISRNLGAPGDFFQSKELMIMGSLSHKFTDKIKFNMQYMKQTWTEDLQEHRTTGAFAPDITGVLIPSLVSMRFVQRQQFWNIDNFNAYFNFDFELGPTKHQLVAGYDLHSWQKLPGGGQNSARGFLLNDGTVSRSFDPANAANYQTIEINGTLMPRPNVNHFDLSNPSATIRNISDYNLNSRFAIPTALTTTHAAYVQDFIKIGKLSVLLSLRSEWFEDITNHNTDRAASFTNTAIIPRVGVTYEVLKNINAYVVYLEGYQPQSNTVTLMPNTGSFFWADQSAAQFDPLISDLKEFGIKASLFNNSIIVNTAIYEINQKNLLISANDPNNPDLLTQRGVDRSRGFEIDIAGFITPDWQINVSYSYIDASIQESDDESLIGKRKENTPFNSGNLWTRYNFPSSSALKGIGIGFGAQHQGNRIPWFTRDFEVPAFTIFDAAIYYAPAKGNLQLALNMRNLANDTYWLGAQNYQRLFPGAPRNYMLTATYRF